MRECPHLEVAKRLLRQETSTKSDFKPTSARTSTPPDSTSAFKKDGTAVVYETTDSPVRVCDPALPVCEGSSPGTPRMALFFVLGAVQTLPTWILADSGSVRNLIDEAVYRKLPYQPPIRDPGDCRVIGGNGEALDLKGFTVLPITLGTALLWHEFGVVPNLPLEVLIGADILASHQCSLLYLQGNQKRLFFGKENCAGCEQFRNDPDVGTSAQLKFVEMKPKRRRNRLRFSANFVATLPEAEECKQNIRRGTCCRKFSCRNSNGRHCRTRTSANRTSIRKTSEGIGRPSCIKPADSRRRAHATGESSEGQSRRVRSITNRPWPNLGGSPYYQNRRREAISPQTQANSFCTPPVPRGRSRIAALNRRDLGSRPRRLPLRFQDGYRSQEGWYSAHVRGLQKHKRSNRERCLPSTSHRHRVANLGQSQILRGPRPHNGLSSSRD